MTFIFFIPNDALNGDERAYKAAGWTDKADKVLVFKAPAHSP